MKIHNKESLLTIRKKLRISQTQTEKEFWKHVRNSRLNGLKFKRQHSISNYVADFYCASHKLTIELDGGIHDTQEQKEKDRIRDTNLAEMGFIVLRFKNKEIFESINYVKERIINVVQLKGRSQI